MLCFTINQIQKKIKTNFSLEIFIYTILFIDENVSKHWVFTPYDSRYKRHAKYRYISN